MSAWCTRWLGKGVSIAVKNINDLIAPALLVSARGHTAPHDPSRHAVSRASSLVYCLCCVVARGRLGRRSCLFQELKM